MLYSIEFIERFEEKYIAEPNSGCWLWDAAADKHGYGRIRIGSKKTGTRSMAIASRVAWEIANGDIPHGLFALHKCDTPACVNPNHLFLGTQLENMSDCSAKGRTSSGEKHSAIQKGHIKSGPEHYLYGKPGRKGEKHPFSKLTAKQVIAIRADGRTHFKVAADYGVSFQVISSIKLRKSWKHI